MSPPSPLRTAVPPEPGPDVRAPRRRSRGVVLVVVIVVALAAAVVVWRLNRDSGVVGDVTVTASSTALGSAPTNAVDTGSASSPGADWRSAGQTAGAWLELSWRKPHELRAFTVVRPALDRPGVTEGFLTFGDGSYLQVTLSTTSRETVVPFTPRSVDRVRFTVSAVAGGASEADLSEVLVSDERSGDDVVNDTSDGNVAVAGSISASPGTPDPHALIDGNGAAGSGGMGTDWTVGQAVGAWVQLDWDRPRELAGVELVGSAASPAALRSATLTFGDGARLPIGAVLTTPDRPTIVSFMPRVARSVRLTLDQVQGGGPLRLAELRVYRAGSTPVWAPVPPPPAASAPPVPAGVTCPAPAADRPASGLVVPCPQTGSDVDGTVALQVSAAAGYGQVTGTVWPGEGSAPAGRPVTATVDPSGAATVPLDTSAVPPGPFTVRVEATGADVPATAVNFQLYRRDATGAATDTVASSTAVGHRTLAYAEEFDHPLTLSRTGLGADYAAAKPVLDGAQDFGDAIFTDPAQGPTTVRVVDDHYLRIDVAPSPPGYPDPQRWNRTHFGGLLGSARPGGSGFAAQYGYFEARMLLPAAPGTWPAFWMLPTANLIGPPPLTSEVDAMEHYGHDPQGACHTVHEYRDGKDNGTTRCGQRFATVRDAMAWHTYGVAVTPTENTYYIDGKVVATTPQAQGSQSPMFFMVNLALGGGWPIDLAAVQDRATVYVDYVRVYV